MRKSFRFLIMLLLVIGGAVIVAALAGAGTTGNYTNGTLIKTIKLGNGKTGVTLLSEDKNGLTVRMNIARIDLIKVNTPQGKFILPRIPGFTRSFKVGEPMLPIAAKLIGIPFGCKLKAKVIDYKAKEITLPLPLMPVQPSLSKSVDPASVKFAYNEDVYSTPGKYSLPAAGAEIMGTMRATRIGRLAISPLEYYPTEKRVKLYRTMTVRITFKNANWNRTRKMWKRYNSVFFEPVERQLLNHDSSRYYKTDMVKYPTKYVIVADRMFESQLQPFIQWKTKKGFTVITGYTDTIGSSTAAIKSYIQGLYNTENPAPSFVLFVGDDQQIPAWSGSAGSHITDLRYCEFTGDDLPEIYYGRFSAQNTSELQPQIDKTLMYEQYTMPDPSYLDEVTLVSGVDSGYADTYGNGQINYGTNLYFNAAHGISPHVWLYPASDGSSAPGDIRQTISDGVGFYNYTAHCSHTGPADPSFSQSDIGNLTNNGKYLLGIGNCCLSNTFGDDYSTPCFGEAWLQAENKGGIGWIGGSNSTYWDEDYWWGVGNGPIDGDGPTYAETGIGAYDGSFHDHGEAVSLHYTTNGAMVFCGNTAVTEAGSSRIQYYWEIYHLMGDPSVMTYMGVPSTNTVSHASSVATDATSFTVDADAGSYVGITKDGVLHGCGYVTTSGTVDVSLTPFGSTGTAIVVVTCQNKQPYEANVTVDSGSSPPTAGFTGTPTSGLAPLTVSFTDQSSGATSWSWNFGDTGTSTQENPSHQYTSPGVYTVSLTVTNAYGNDTETKTDYITVAAMQPPVADFTASSTGIYEGSNVTFTDQSTNNPTSWSWTFSGGTPSSSTAQNPTITYNTAGTYAVSLTAYNGAGNDTETKTGYITVSDALLDYCASQGNDYSYEWIADVDVEDIANASGAAGYTDFTSITGNLTAGANAGVSLTPGFSGSTYTEHWKIYIDYNIDGDFEDAGEEVFYQSGTSTVSGSFTVPAGASGLTRMRVSMKYNAAQTPCETFTYGEVEDYMVNITGAVPQPPVANFTASSTTINEGQSVTFTDTSTENPTSWSWSFEGGTPSGSTSQNPSVTYNTAGTYNVTLTASSAYGSDDEVKVDYITVTAASADEIAEAVDNGSLTFTKSGSADWYKDTGVYYYDGDSAGSGTITHNQSTTIETSVTVGSTQAVKFYWKVSSETNYDYLRFYIDGVEQTTISGTVDWTQVAYNIDAGTHTLKWSYTKDGSVSSGSDRGWVDKLEITAPAADAIAEAVDYPALTFSLSGNGDWFPQTTTTYFDGDAAESANIVDSQTTTMETTISGKTSVKFYWKVSSESNYDYLRFYIDGVEQDSISGTVNWAQKTYTVSSGAHTLKWSFTKDGSVSSGSDCGWVDKVELQ
ncbi:MAG: PKD domain-containing protein [Candidatus Aminicenantes bacterium]|nr:PKD domain-containing protein [Candidatus Aminicenantes bacterium]